MKIIRDALLMLSITLMACGFIIVFFDWNARKIVTCVQWDGFCISMIGLLLFLFIMHRKK